ncbi:MULTISPECIES: hypothetical protein [unclassified Massilia]|uniref:hypothetical protein n=1 Tax=unclassified Massilia TaxID=2609279 RepID=UPI00177FCD9E|nr:MULTISPECIES: hypothetical protein [unclassified Massilia]MBD8528969.1 hypothetical protein [Massilia sp. CFBP 13647]MBD8672363.1 hypothetical protein [Massilia sp. CFBP 13721]
MNPLSLSAPLLPPVTPPLQANAIAAIAPVAFAAAQAELPLPQAQPLAPPQAAAGAEHADGLAMRPDQVFMTRQMVFSQADGRTLAGNWRAMVGTYGATLAEREWRTRAGALPPLLLLAGQEGRAPARPVDGQLPADAWRFTVHAGSAQAQHLQVVRKGADGGGGRRRRPRAALRLELALADGTHVALQVEPAPGGVAIELAVPDAYALARLRALQPALDAAVARAGLVVVRWSFKAGIAPAGSAHALLAAEDAAQVLTLPVFQAVAELALMLPAQG